MVITMSSVIFILVTAGFGVRIHRNSGILTTEYDWSQYIDNKTGAFDPSAYDPMDQWMSKNNWMIFVSFVGFYYASIIGFTYYWFQYNKWKWNNIPTNERFEEKIVKLKIPDNALYRVEMLNRRK